QKVADPGISRVVTKNRPKQTLLSFDLVGRKPDLIMAGSPPAAFPAKSATSTIPIVFRHGGDPVGDGLVASLARPDGNLTGVSQLGDEGLTAKRLSCCLSWFRGLG